MTLQDHLPAPFAPVDRTLPAMLKAGAARFGDKTLFSCGGETWTYRDAVALAARSGAALAEAGIGPGDRIAVFSNNRPEVMRAFLGAGWIGAVTVPINTAAKGPQLRYYLKNSGARLLLVEAELQPVLESADLSGLALERIWLVDGTGPARLSGCSCAMMPAGDTEAEPALVQPGDTLVVLYTSGTTGPSKGVLCPHAQYFWWGANTSRLLQITTEDVLVTTLPLFHTNALNTFAQALLTGASQVVERRFSASGFWPSMERHGATVTYLLGAMVPILLAQPPGAAERAHRVRIALGPGVPANRHGPFRERTGVELLEGYGSTETNFALGGFIADQRAGHMGRVLPGFQAQVVDEADNALPDGEAGELVLRSAEPFSFATGYLGMPEKTVEAWRNLWFHTGDRVVRDQDGYFRFVDRLKDAIRRRGENISSFEVEQVLSGHPDVDTVAVYPVRSDLGEDEVMAAIVPRGGARLDPLALMSFCEPRLPHYAIPRYLLFAPDLPRTENGKVKKFELRERGATYDTWDREAAGYVVRR